MDHGVLLGTAACRKMFWKYCRSYRNLRLPHSAWCVRKLRVLCGCVEACALRALSGVVINDVMIEVNAKKPIKPATSCEQILKLKSLWRGTVRIK